MGTSTKRSAARDYQRSHPWITFTLDLTRVPYSLWLALGAVQSKFEHVGNAMLPPEIAQKLHSLYLAKGIHGTTAIEGNTLSEEQVIQRIERRGPPLPPSQEYQGQEIDNIVDAVNLIAERAASQRDYALSAEQIKEYNGLVLRDLPLDEDVVPGEIRQHSVGVRGTQDRGAPAKDCDYLLSRLCDWLSEMQRPDSIPETAFAVVKAVAAHLYLAWIHPFGDGNGRTARLVEVHIMLAANIPTAAAHLLSNHYNRTRPIYYRELAEASRTEGPPIGFLQYAVNGLRDALDEQIDTIRQHQYRVAWRDHVYNTFRDRKGDAAQRQRALALHLGAREEQAPPVRVAMIRRLNPELAAMYSGKTSKTVTRDVNALLNTGLIRRVGRAEITDRRELLLALLPQRRGSPGE